MAQIEVKYDPIIQQEPIIDTMYATGDDPNAVANEVEQTKITGIVAPLVKLNNLTINFGQIESMRLSCVDLLPSLYISITDSLGLSKILDQPVADNILRLQILPQFDNAYKKVDLTFYITNYRTEGNNIEINAVYNIKEIYKNRLEAYGQLSYYELCDKIAKACNIGFASNISDTNDKRYMYCKNQSFLELMVQEVKRSGTERLIPDVWIDWFNYLNLVDVWERYQSVDPIYKIWSSPYRQIDTSTGAPVQPVEVDSIITNTVATGDSQLFTQDYMIQNDAMGNVFAGTDKVIEIYNYDKGDTTNLLIQDGDVHNDIFIKTVYRGESFDGNQIQLQESCRRMAMQKIYGQCIKITLETPVLALVRGQKVDFRWYDVNDYVNEAKKKNDIRTVADGPDEEVHEEQYSLNKQVSGQYLILSTDLLYDGAQATWEYELLLGRPADQIKVYGDDNEQ